MVRTGRPPVPHVEVTCTGCGTSIKRRESEVARNTTGIFYCSNNCPGKAGKGNRPRRGGWLICPECDGRFYRRTSQLALPTDGREPCCSVGCAARHRSKHADQNPDIPFRITTICERCGKPFEHARCNPRRFCSGVCAGVAKVRCELTCEWCGETYEGNPQVRRFCSKPCFYAQQSANAQGSITDDGYRVLFIDGRQVPEHRHVMQAVVDRELTPEETVHHRNGVKLDNRPENLELWASNHPRGQRVLDLIDWAREILGRYEPDEAALRRLEAQAVALEALARPVAAGE
jgi:hypothetical protein